MKKNSKPIITFLKVWDNHSKLKAVLNTVKDLVLQKKRILIAVPNSAAANYLDDLLWKEPEESFIPHFVKDIPCEDPLIISTIHSNFNNAKVLINLCPEISPISIQFEYIFDLDDFTTNSKAELSAKRKEAYEHLA